MGRLRSKTYTTHREIDRRVGARAYARRISLGLTQAEVATQLGVSTHQYSKYERGVDVLDPATLLDLSSILGVSIGYFFEDLDTPGIKLDRRTLWFVQKVLAIKDEVWQREVCNVTRTLAGAPER